MTTPPTLLAAAAVACLALTATGCSETLGDDRRIADLDGGLILDGGLEGPGVCNSRVRCPDDTTCVLGSVPVPDGGMPAGRCRPLCRPGAEDACPADQVCVAGSEGDGACLPFLEVDRGIGAECPRGGADCLQGVCVETDRGRFCARPCGASAPEGADPSCPSVASCESLPAAPPVSESTTVCTPVGSTGSEVVDAPCPNGSADCASALCVDFGEGPRCARACTADGDCGDEQMCSDGATSEGEAVQICGPESGVIGDFCESGMEDCRSGLCLVQGNPTGVCTEECGGAEDCPQGWSCRTFQGRDGQPVNVCAPLGEVGDRCQSGMEDCASTLCLVTGRFGVCTQLCEDSDGCPNNWRCVTVPGREGPQNVCTPRF